MEPHRNQLLRAILILYGLSVVVVLGSFFAQMPPFHTRLGKTQTGSIAVVHIYGAIRTSDSASAWGSQNADEIAHRLHELADDKDVKAILLRINSPGGTVGAVQEIYEEVMKCKAKGKKVVASLGDVAASGGYYIASSADRIVSNPGTITGSIGVILEFGNLEGLFEKLGVRLQVVKSGAHKDIGSPARALTPEERQMLQASIDDAYAQFVDAVVKGRGLVRDKVIPLADGRIFTGRQAMQGGLVDEMGDYEDAILVATRLANLAPNPSIVSDHPKSLAGLLKHLSSRSKSDFFESLNSRSPGFTLEYSLR